MNLEQIKNFKNDINTITRILIGGSITLNQYDAQCDSTIWAHSVTFDMSEVELRDILKK